LPLEELRKISRAFDDDFARGLTVEAALASKKIAGGTSIDSVRVAVSELEKRIAQEMARQ